MEQNHKIGQKCYIECILDGQYKNGYEVKELDYLEGEEAGIKECNI